MIVPSTPTTDLPVGQDADVTLVPVESDGPVATTRWSPAGAGAQVAYAVRLQLAVVPLSSSAATTVTLSRLPLGVRPPIRTFL